MVGSATGLAVRPQSALVALLSRLLPVIESFFLVHVGDIFNVANTGGALPKVEDGTTSASTSAAAATTGAGPNPSPGVIATTAAAAVATSEVTGAGSPPPAAAASTSQATPAAAPATTPSSAVPPSSSTQSSMPGERYRSTPAYAALNLSLLPPDVLAAIGQVYGSPPSSPHATSAIHAAAAATATAMTGGGGSLGGPDLRDDPSSFAATVLQLTSLQRTRSLRSTSSSFGLASSSGPQFLALPHSSSASTLMGLAGT